MTIVPRPATPKDDPNDADLGGLHLFVVMAIGFLALMGYIIWPEVVETAQQFSTYETTTGSITQVIPPNPRAADQKLRAGQIQFNFEVDGREWQAFYPPEYPGNMARAAYTLFDERPAPGQSVTVYYDPAQPQHCTLERRVEPLPFAMFVFLAPLVYLIWQTLRGRMAQFRPISNIHSPDAFSAFFASYFVVSAVSGLILSFLVSSFDWKVTLAIANVLLVALPLACSRAARYFTAVPENMVGNPDPIETTNDGQEPVAAEAITDRQQLFVMGIFAIFVGAIVGALVWAGILRPLAQYWHARQTYVSTLGVVLKLEIEDHAHDSDKDSYLPVIRYEFFVNGNRYESDRLYIGSTDVGIPNFWAERIIAQYKVGQKVWVYYDPSDPSQAVLDLSFWKYYAFFAYFLSVGVYFECLILLPMALIALKQRAAWERLAAAPGFGKAVAFLLVTHILCALFLFVISDPQLNGFRVIVCYGVDVLAFVFGWFVGSAGTAVDMPKASTNQA